MNVLPIDMLQGYLFGSVIMLLIFGALLTYHNNRLIEVFFKVAINPTALIGFFLFLKFTGYI